MDDDAARMVSEAGAILGERRVGDDCVYFGVGMELASDKASESVSSDIVASCYLSL